MITDWGAATITHACLPLAPDRE